jgi:hypothetical protein
LPVKAGALPASAVAYGQKSPDWLASYDPNTFSWKTSQRSFLEDWTKFSGTWPRSGMMRNGIAYRLPPLVPLTGATASGLWQTPVADDAVDQAAGKFNSRDEPKLSAQVKLWPTPTVNGNYNRKGASAKAGDGLETAVQLWPTPTSRDWKDGSAKACENVPVNGLLGRAVHQFNTPRTTPRTARELDGVSPLGNGGLNPTWVEWLMGFPSGWTDLKRSEMPSSHRSRK